ncbi:Germ cell-expressed protein R06C7.1 [Aphelenchoides fujianensis]|nr:Germ cell-expressed protein R06C7.1 [Aphelenchoides fujianensis]
MAVKPKSTCWRYDVEISKPSAGPKKPEKIYTKQNDTGIRTAQRQACTDIIETLHGLTQGFGASCQYAYDGKRTLFTNKEINLQRQKTTVQNNQLKKRAALFVKGDSVNVTITPNERCPKLDYSDFKDSLVGDVTLQSDRSVRQFLEILTSQHLINSDKYSNVSSGTLFENDSTPLVPGMQMRVGFKKGVRITEEKGVPTALMVVDMKRTAFIAKKKVSEIFADFQQNSRNPRDAQWQFEKLMKGVRCVVDYDPSRTLVVDRMTRFPVNNQQYSVQGQTLKDFVHSKHKITINDKNPGIHPQQPNGQKIVYPMEVLSVLHGQLVPMEKLTAQASKNLLTENSIPPTVRMNYVLQQMKEVATGPAATFLQQWGVCIDVKSNQITINQRRLPTIKYGKDKIVKPQANGSWFKDATDAPFLFGATKLTRWIVLHDPTVNSNAVKSFINSLLKKCNDLGAVVPPPGKYATATVQQLESFFTDPQCKPQFIFYIDANNASHRKLKLYEAYYKILTQHLVAKNLTGGPQLLSNVSMKLNIKAFGVNYVPQIPAVLKDWDLQHTDLLVIGLDVAHPSKLSPKEMFELKKKHSEMINRHPSVVGICANKSANPFIFAPDFFYQECRREAIEQEPLTTAVQQAVEMACKNGRRPTRIVVVRDGLSEGQLSMAATEEVPAIREGWRNGIAKTEEMANAAVKITFVVCTKMHQKRYYRANGNQIANTQPGDVIDSKVVRTDIPEFFLQSHYPLKGVPKIPQYDVVVNELGLSMHLMQEMFLNWSHMHQVAACPTSLPLPVYLAHETAKRGQDVYNELFSLRNVRAPYGAPQGGNQQVFAPELEMHDGVFDFKALTKKLGYSKHALGGTRFNA